MEAISINEAIVAMFCSRREKEFWTLREGVVNELRSKNALRLSLPIERLVNTSSEINFAVSVSGTIRGRANGKIDSS